MQQIYGGKDQIFAEIGILNTPANVPITYFAFIIANVMQTLFKEDNGRTSFERPNLFKGLRCYTASPQLFFSNIRRFSYQSNI